MGRPHPKKLLLPKSATIPQQEAYLQNSATMPSSSITDRIYTTEDIVCDIDDYCDETNRMISQQINYSEWNSNSMEYVILAFLCNVKTRLILILV